MLRYAEENRSVSMHFASGPSGPDNNQGINIKVNCNTLLTSCQGNGTRDVLIVLFIVDELVVVSLDSWAVFAMLLILKN